MQINESPRPVGLQTSSSKSQNLPAKAHNKIRFTPRAMSSLSKWVDAKAP